MLSANCYSAGSSSNNDTTTTKKTNYERAVSFINEAKKLEQNGKQKKADKQYENAQKTYHQHLELCHA